MSRINIVYSSCTEYIYEHAFTSLNEWMNDCGDFKRLGIYIQASLSRWNHTVWKQSKRQNNTMAWVPMSLLYWQYTQNQKRHEQTWNSPRNKSLDKFAFKIESMQYKKLAKQYVFDFNVFSYFSLFVTHSHHISPVLVSVLFSVFFYLYVIFVILFYFAFGRYSHRRGYNFFYMYIILFTEIYGNVWFLVRPNIYLAQYINQRTNYMHQYQPCAL